MKDVSYNGEWLIVKAMGNPSWKEIKRIADESPHPSCWVDGSWYIKPMKKNVKALAELGLEADDSAAFLFRGFNNSFTTRTKSDTPNFQEIKKIDWTTLPGELYDFQKEGVQWLLTPNNKLLGDEMGLGKTVQVTAWLRLQPEYLPALVICPASLKLNWQREVEKWTGKKAQVIYGFDDYPMGGLLEKYPVVVINYKILGKEKDEERLAEKKRKAECKLKGQKYTKKHLDVFGWCDIFSALPFKSIIIDEVQAISNPDTNIARAVTKICRAIPNIKKVFLSGTPYETRAAQFFTSLNLLDSKTFPNRYKYLYRYCDPKKDFWGWHFDGLTNGVELHEKVKPLMLRRLKENVLTQLPAKQKSIIPMELNKKALADYELEDDLFYEALKNKKQLNWAQLKQRAYTVKRDAVIQWIKDYLELTENKLVVFCYHHKAFDDLINEFKDIAVGLNGETPEKQRQEVVDRFQTDKKIKLFIGNTVAAGVGITLTAASACVFVEFGTTPAQHAQAEDRIHRISQKADSVLIYYLIAQGTIDEDMIEGFQIKNERQKLVMDGKEGDSFFGESLENFNKGIIAHYLLRKERNDVKD
jgi:SWI/SNF-related matrix-associated actin-dependent regulator 1 of chromatin subfamily A